jgi:hypothetical protein
MLTVSFVRVSQYTEPWRLAKGADFIERLPATPIQGLLQESWREWGDEIREKQGNATTV